MSHFGTLYQSNKLHSFINRTNKFFQPKLAINHPSDIYEQEANAMAEKIVGIPANENNFFQPTNSIQRKCAACEEEEKHLQMKGGGGSNELDSSGVNDIINSPGQSLDPDAKNFMELGFGYDFSHVQIHNDPPAHRSSSGINALAYTYGQHIVFGKDQYQPSTNEGKKLIAHELTHVIQQSQNMASGIQRRTDAFGKECPDTVEIGDKKAIPAFNKDMFDAGYRTYFGLVTSMRVGPKNSYDSCITEVLKVEENTCGNTGNMANYDPCTPKDHCMKINDACPGGSCGDSLTHTGFAASPNAFIDLHRTERNVSLLGGTGKNECKVKCLQRYGCGGKEIGRFYITRNFKLGEYNDGKTKTPITTGSIEKEPAKK